MQVGRPKTAVVVPGVHELGSIEKPKFEPKIDPSKRVVNEEYFKALKDIKAISGPSKQSEKSMARTRFDGETSQH